MRSCISSEASNPDNQSRKGMIGLALIGAGTALTAVGLLFIVPVCASWSRGKLQRAYEKGKQGMLSSFESATDVLQDVASKAQHPLSEAAKSAKHTTAIAAGAVETAAHYVRERLSEVH